MKGKEKLGGTGVLLERCGTVLSCTHSRIYGPFTFMRCYKPRSARTSFIHASRLKETRRADLADALLNLRGGLCPVNSRSTGRSIAEATRVTSRIVMRDDGGTEDPTRKRNRKSV